MPARSNVPRRKKQRRQPTFAPGFPRVRVRIRSSRPRPAIRKAVNKMEVAARPARQSGKEVKPEFLKKRKLTFDVLYDKIGELYPKISHWTYLDDYQRKTVIEALIRDGYAASIEKIRAMFY